MPRRTFVSHSTVVAAAILASLALSQPAAASCMRPPPLDKALAAVPVVFVGTVVDTQHDGRTATFDVEEIWKGSVGARVVVNGGPSVAEMENAEAQGQVAATSVDRAYETGVRYLVVPFGASGNVLTDNACSSTQPYTAKLASHAPPGAAPPESATSALAPSSSNDEGAQPWQFVLVALGMAALLAVALAIARRSRRPRPSS
ncbi:MAG: hypothetical protein ACR2L0_09660 [Gaiellaceae bacterium]